MISSRYFITRYPFFAGLDKEYKHILTNVAGVQSVETGYIFFREGDELDSFYMVVEGEVAIVYEVPNHDVEHTLTMQLTRNMITDDITVSTVGPGEIFGWSGIIPPHVSTAGTKAIKNSQVVEFDCKELRPIFEKDSRFAYLMTLKAAQTIRKRLRNRLIESVAEFA